MPLFTRENAAILGRKGAVARWSKPPEPPPSPPMPETSPFLSARLVRVRRQLERLDEMASRERDTKRLKELADATWRLQEQERILDGRPQPGSLRPRAPRSNRLDYSRLADLADRDDGTTGKESLSPDRP